MALARMTITSTAIGNLDMHAKNLSILHPKSAEISLAPAYDFVPQRHMNNDGKFALAINKKYLASQVAGADVVAELSSWGISNANKLVAETLEEIASVLTEEMPRAGAYLGLQEELLAATSQLITSI